MNRRLSNWPRALDTFIAAHAETPFAWGTNDCIMFASEAIAAITGHDPAAEWRGRYRSALGAARIFRPWGGFGEMVAAIAEASGYHGQNVLMAQRGDLMLLPTTATGLLWPAAGVCLGKVSAFAGPTGLTLRRTVDCNRSWRI